MPRINPIVPASADVQTQSTLSAVKAKVGMLPNLHATLAHSSVALNMYLAMNDITSKGKLIPAQREIIALAVGQANACQYCLSAHTLLGKRAGLADGQITEARRGRSDAGLDNAIALLARQYVVTKGVLTDADLANAKEAGIDESLVFEILANVVMNIFTNYTNHLAETDIDFPLVEV